MSKKSNELITSKVQKMFHLRPKNAAYLYEYSSKKGAPSLLRLPIPKKCVILRDLAWLVQLKDVKTPMEEFYFWLY